MLVFLIMKPWKWKKITFLVHWKMKVGPRGCRFVISSKIDIIWFDHFYIWTKWQLICDENNYPKNMIDTKKEVYCPRYDDGNRLSPYAWDHLLRMQHNLSDVKTLGFMMIVSYSNQVLSRKVVKGYQARHWNLWNLDSGNAKQRKSHFHKKSYKKWWLLYNSSSLYSNLFSKSWNYITKMTTNFAYISGKYDLFPW